MRVATAASAELAAARVAWEDPFTDSGWRELARLTAAAPVGTVLAGQYMPALTVAQTSSGWARLTGDGREATPGEWCRCDPPPESWVYYETWDKVHGRIAHGWVDADCRRLVQSG